MKSVVNSEVLIVVKGRCATCSHIPNAMLESLQYPELSYQHRGRDLGWQLSTVRVFENNHDGSVTISTGSVPRISGELQTAGYRVRIDDQRTLPFVVQTHDIDVYRNLDGPQRRLSDLIINNRQFVLETNQKTASETMGCVARLYPQARIFVPIPKVTTDAYAQVNYEIGKYVGGNVGRANAIQCECDKRIAVGSYQQFLYSNPAVWDIVLFPYAEDAVAKSFADGARPYESHLLYGFVHPGTNLSKRDRLRLELLAGPILVDDQNDRRPDPAATAVFCCSRTSPLSVPSEPLARKRIGIWQNETRNRLIVDVAQAFADGDEAAICSLFRVDQDLSLFSAGRRSVVVFVESPEHGRVLANLMNGWELVTGENIDRYLRYPTNFGQKIVTTVAASRIEILTADVLIRGDGGVGIIRPAMPTPSFVEVRPQSLIVDFVDDFEASFIADTQSRALAYSKQGFNVRSPKWLMQSQFINRDKQKPRHGHRVRRRHGPVINY